MSRIAQELQKNPLVYVARDVERALGLPPTPGYSIITNATPYAKSIAATRGDIILVESDRHLDTHELLTTTIVQEFFAKHPNTNVVVFKNTSLIERAAATLGVTIINPAAALGREVEEKLTQLTWLGELTALLPNHFVAPCRELRYEGKPFVVQFNHAHTGQGTTLVDNDRALKLLQAKFPSRDVRVSDYITGPMVTLIACVWGDAVLTSTINYQITGLPPFTENPFATIGNDWALPKTLLTKDQASAIQSMAVAIGTKLSRGGWKGLFGIDVIVDEKTGKPLLIEINARQQAGATFESQLQSTTATETALTTFDAHLCALAGLPYHNEHIVPITDGGQIIYRVPRTGLATEKKISAEKLNGLTLITYNNTAPGADLFRVQSFKGIMQSHTAFNEIGETIKQVVA